MKTLTLLLLVGVISACQAAENSTMSSSIQDVKAKHESQLMAKPGVVSVGIGKGDGGQPVVIIGVENEAALTASELPKELDGYPVKTQVIGTIRAQ